MKEKKTPTIYTYIRIYIATKRDVVGVAGVDESRFVECEGK